MARGGRIGKRRQRDGAILRSPKILISVVAFFSISQLHAFSPCHSSRRYRYKKSCIRTRTRCFGQPKCVELSAKELCTDGPKIELSAPTVSPKISTSKVLNDSAEDPKISTCKALNDFAKDLSRLSVLRPADPSADFSQHLPLVSAGSSYTRVWNDETWKKHTLSLPHERYLRHLLRWRQSTTAQKVFPAVLISAAWAVVVSAVVQASPGSYLVNASKSASAAVSGLSAPLALLLTLRTNAALGRLSEARLAWGRLVLHTRTLAAHVRTYILPLHPEAAVLAARHVAMLGWLLKSACRYEDRERELEVMKVVLPDEADYQWLASHPKPVWGAAVRLRQIVASVAGSCSNNFLVPHQLMEEGIANFESVAGICERLLASPIPPTYSRHLSRVLTIWLAMLPIGLIGSGVPVLGTIFASAFTSYVLVGLDELTIEIEHPFPLLPMQQLATAVQRGVGMQLMDYECSGEVFDEYIFTSLPAVPLQNADD